MAGIGQKNIFDITKGSLSLKALTDPGRYTYNTIMNGPTPTVASPPAMPDDEQILAAQRQSAAQQLQRSGRSTTILSGGDNLG